MGFFDRLKAMVPGFRSAHAAPPAGLRPIRPRPSTDERIAPDNRGGIAGRVWFLPYAEHSSTGDTPEIRAAMRLMLRDPYIKAGWLSQTLTVLSQDFQVHPDAERPKDSLAQEQAKFIRHCVEQSDGEMVGLGSSIITNLGSDGFSLAEKVWQVFPRGPYANKIGLRALKPKDPNNLTMVGDEFRNITGIRDNRTNETFPIGDFTYVRYMHTFDEPGGMAAFRAGYGPYWMRDTVRKLRAIHLEKKSAGTVKGTYTDPSDKTALENALARLKTSTWVAVPEGVQIEAINLSTASEPDYKSFDESLREETLVAVAMAHLHILQGGVSDARGDTKIHKAVSDLGPWLLTYIVQYVLNRQVIPDLIDYNYPAAQGYPRITLGGVTNQEILELLQVLEGAQRAGFKPSKSYYASALTIQEADPAEPDDQLAPPQQAMLPGGMGGIGGLGGGGDPFGGMGGGDPFAPAPMLPGGGGGGQDNGFGVSPFNERAGFSDDLRELALSGVQKFGWQAARSKTGGIKAVGTGEHAGRTEYGKRAEQVLRGGRRESGPKPADASAATDDEDEAAGPKPPNVALSDAIAKRLANGGSISAQELWAAANSAYGGTRAGGAYGPSDAYDALEAGVNKALMGRTDPRADLAGAQEQVRILTEQMSRLPTQTNRSGNKDVFQQFSTPPNFAYAVAWAANLRPGETVLEPSAGTGSLAVHAMNAGAKVLGNELDAKRVALLDDLLGKGKVTKENAEQIGAILHGKVQPDVVLMNPPFSATAGRTKNDRMTAAKHIDEALSLLSPNGRLVAIVGEGMTPDKRSLYSPWFQSLARRGYNLVANVGLEGGNYAKYGTSFGNRVLVIDKVKPDGTPSITGDAKDVPELLNLLAGARNARPENSGEDRSAGAGAGSGRGGILPPGGGAGGLPGGVSGRGGRKARGKGSAATQTADGIHDPLGDPESGGSVGGRGSRTGGSTGATKRGSGTGGKLSRNDAVQVPEFRPPVELKIQAAAEGGGELVGGEESIFNSYRPAVAVPGSKPHPDALVESAAMAAVRPPAATYRPKLSQDIVDQGVLSDAQLESVIYAGQNHTKMLDGGTDKDGNPLPQMRRGYFIGDGTGAGKGRQIAGIIADNFNQGRKKAIWISKTAALYEDARRDALALGIHPDTVHKFESLKSAEPPKEGTAFLTYDTLKSRAKKPNDDGTMPPSNVERLADWFGRDFDGVIAFDESHMMANVLGKKGERGDVEGSQRAAAGIELQKLLPNARVVYVSATGATEVSNLAYADRLGIWGKGTPFANKQSFISAMDKGGVAAMEATAQSLKAMGMYGARSLSFDNGKPDGKVTYSRLTHSLTPDQLSQYDAAAEAWQTVLQNIDKALEETGGNQDRNAKSAARSQFWGAQQRFFNQVMTSMQTPSVIKAIEDDLAGKGGNGKPRSAVIQLVNTSEAATDRAINSKDPEADYESLDVSPKAILMQYLDKSFPTEKYETYLDENGNERTRPVTDAAGNIVHDPRALKRKNELMDKVGSIRVPEGPLDMILNHFGTSKVAEATGRRQRVTWQEQPDGSMKKLPEKRNPDIANLAEATAFQDGKKRILVFSDAGGTGRSYHADLKAKNQDQRVHYMLQPGWRADNAVQGLGRTHRTNQALAPTYRLVEIEQLKGQKRFVSTIARRLDQLGAITRGQRQTGSAGLFSAADNLESREARMALQSFWDDLKRGDIPGLSHQEVMEQLGYEKKEEDDDGPPKRRRGSQTMDDAPPIPQFLNRLLSLKVADQAKVFEAFDTRLKQTVANAMERGELDVGVENYKADQIRRVEEPEVYTDPDTGAKAKLLTTLVKRKQPRVTFEATKHGELPVGYVKNNISGKVRAVYKTVDHTDSDGNVTSMYRLVGPVSTTTEARAKVDHLNFSKVDEATAQKLWAEELAAAPTHQETEAHFLTGAILPIWDRVPGEQPKIYRITPDGDPHATVGRIIAAKHLPELLKRLGKTSKVKEYKPSDVYVKLVGGASADLANGWKLKRVRVGGENRIELIGVGPGDFSSVASDGVIRERIQWDTRHFIPIGPAGEKVIERLTKNRPVTGMSGGTEEYSERRIPLSVCDVTWDVFADGGAVGRWKGPFRGPRGGVYWLPVGSLDQPQNREYSPTNPGDETGEYGRYGDPHTRGNKPSSQADDSPVTIVSGTDPKKVAAIFGGKMPNDSQLSAIGMAIGNSSVEVEDRGGVISLFTSVRTGSYESRSFAASRTIRRRGNELICDNDSFVLKYAAPGAGTRLFVAQVRALRELGFSKITTYASGDATEPGPYNGFYTWAVLGYDGKIPERHYSGKPRLPDALAAVAGPNRSILKLIQNPAGRAWWKKHGSEWNGEFDLRDGSPSMIQLAAYLRERAANEQAERRKAIAGIPGSPNPVAGRGSGGSGSGPGGHRFAEEFGSSGTGAGGSLDRSSSDELALAGPDGQRAADLLAASKAEGLQVLHRLAADAIRRILGDPDPLSVPTFFTDDELKDLAKSLAAATATADLLGRARVHRMAVEAEKRFATFADPPPDDDSSALYGPFDRIIPHVPPLEAVGYFNRLVPTLGIDPQRFGPRYDRHAFTLAVAADDALLTRIRNLIAQQLETGSRPDPVRDIQDYLDAAGVSPRNPQYAEAVYRTSMNDSYTAGQSAELASPPMQQAFPVWEYHAIIDGRERPTHGARDGKFYPSDVSFAEVRGTDASDVINCRCGFSPVSKWEWERLQRGGATVEDTW